MEKSLKREGVGSGMQKARNDGSNKLVLSGKKYRETRKKYLSLALWYDEEQCNREARTCGSFRPLEHGLLESKDCRISICNLCSGLWLQHRLSLDENNYWTEVMVRPMISIWPGIA